MLLTLQVLKFVKLLVNPYKLLYPFIGFSLSIFWLCYLTANLESILHDGVCLCVHQLLVCDQLHFVLEILNGVLWLQNQLCLIFVFSLKFNVARNLIVTKKLCEQTLIFCVHATICLLLDTLSMRLEDVYHVC